MLEEVKAEAESEPVESAPQEIEDKVEESGSEEVSADEDNESTVDSVETTEETGTDKESGEM